MRSPEEDLAHHYAALRVCMFAGESPTPTATERREAAFAVRALRGAGWRLLRDPNSTPKEA